MGKWVVLWGAIAIGLSVLAIVISAIIGKRIKHSGGSVEAAKAAAKKVALLAILGVVAICLGSIY